MIIEVIFRYRIEKGDTLWSIAEKYLGNSYKWVDLYSWNMTKIDNPNLIFEGDIIEIRREIKKDC